MDTFKEIKIPGQTVETHIEVDLDTNKQTQIRVPRERPTRQIEVTLEPDAPPAEELSHSDDVQMEPVVVETQQTPVIRQERKKPSRAQKRIRDLNNKANELELQLERERQEKHELLKKLNEGKKNSKETEKQSLEREIATLTDGMRKAMQDGDTDKVVTLQQQLMSAHTNLKVAELEINQVEDVPEYKPQAAKQPSMPEAAQAWLEDHPEFFQDVEFNNAAKRVNQSLLMEGYDIESEDFYEELNLRLSRRFPQYVTGAQQQFVPPQQNVVEYDYETPSPQDVKPATAVKRPQAPPVSGAARTASPNPQRHPMENKVNLTEADLEQMERWDMGINRMARRKDHIAKNRRQDGYVPIIIPQK